MYHASCTVYYPDKKCTIYIYIFLLIIFYIRIVSVPTCFTDFNNFVTLAKRNVKIPCRRCRFIETCSSAYNIQNVISVYVVLLLI